MKKPINIYEGLFLVLFLHKLEHPAFSTWLVFLPFILDWLHTAVARMLEFYKIPDKYRFFVWKLAHRRDLKKAAGKAKDIMKAAKPGNPGQFYDQQKVGKS